MDNQVSTENNLAKTTSMVARVTTTEMARSLVLQYAQTLVGSQRAKEFITQMGFLMRTNSKIARCTPESIFTAMMQCIRLDLLPNTPEQYAALIPYGSELQFQLMYPGGIELAYRSGVVSTIKADVVFPEDEFDYDDAINYIHHKKSLTIDRTKANNIIAAYAVGKLSNGEVMFEVMSPSEIQKIKDKAVKAKSADSPWAQWEERMIRKSPLKRLFNVLPSSTKDNRFKEAAHWDSLTEAGKKVKADPSTGQIIEYDALESEKATEEEKDEIVKANTVTDTTVPIILPMSYDKNHTKEESDSIDLVKQIFPEAKDVTPKETVREKAERLYMGKGKNQQLIDSKEDKAEDQELLEGLRGEDG
jgi:recombination protein RecT